MNKKLFALLLVFSMMMIALGGCAQNKEQTEVNKDERTQKQEQTAVNKDENTKKVEAVDVKKVFVTPEWVKNVIDGEQAESKKYVILEASWRVLMKVQIITKDIYQVQSMWI